MSSKVPGWFDQATLLRISVVVCGKRHYILFYLKDAESVDSKSAFPAGTSTTGYRISQLGLLPPTSSTFQNALHPISCLLSQRSEDYECLSSKVFGCSIRTSIIGYQISQLGLLPPTSSMSHGNRKTIPSFYHPSRNLQISETLYESRKTMLSMDPLGKSIFSFQG